MARKHRVPLVYVNQFGGNDDLVFDGRSCGVRRRRARRSPAAARSTRDVVICDLDDGRADRRRPPISTPNRRSGARSCSARATTRASAASARAVLGLSGGIDSALTAAIAAEALGADQRARRADAVALSRAAAASTIRSQLAANLGIETLTLPIDDAPCRRWRARSPTRSRAPTRDVTEENIQARIRGNLLMALSNKRGALLLTTGNKSELAVGYCTLYGDMSGGLGVIADVPKTMVYRVARWLNATRGPRGDSRADPDEGAVGRAAAEPDRPGLAAAVRRARRHPAAPHRAAPAGRCRSSRRASTPATVHRVLRLVRSAEFKRKQAAPGLKVTDRAFGTGWRMPIAATADAELVRA